MEYEELDCGRNEKHHFDFLSFTFVSVVVGVVAFITVSPRMVVDSRKV